MASAGATLSPCALRSDTPPCASSQREAKNPRDASRLRGHDVRLTNHLVTIRCVRQPLIRMRQRYGHLVLGPRRSRTNESKSGGGVRATRRAATN